MVGIFVAGLLVAPLKEGLGEGRSDGLTDGFTLEDFTLGTNDCATEGKNEGDCVGGTDFGGTHSPYRHCLVDGDGSMPFPSE